MKKLIEFVGGGNNLRGVLISPLGGNAVYLAGKGDPAHFHIRSGFIVYCYEASSHLVSFVQHSLGEVFKHYVSSH